MFREVTYHIDELGWLAKINRSSRVDMARLFPEIEDKKYTLILKGWDRTISAVELHGGGTLVSVFDLSKEILESCTIHFKGYGASPKSVLEIKEEQS